MLLGILVRALIGSALVAGATAAFAQQIWVGGGGRFGGMRPRWPAEEDFDGRFMYCRGYYEGPATLRRLEHRLPRRRQQLLHPPFRADPRFGEVRSDRQPHHVRRLADRSAAYWCPILFMANVGTAMFTAEETGRLREYFLKGGFLC